MNKRNPLKTAFDACQRSREKALDKLIEKIRLVLQRACDRWGWGFISGNGGYDLEIYGKSVVTYDNYKVQCDTRFLLDFFEPELADVLEEQIDGQSLGSFIGNVGSTRENEPKFAIVLNDESELDLIALDADGKLSTEKIMAFALKAKINEGCAFGPLNQALALAVIDSWCEFEDRDRAIILLKSLPQFKI